MPHNVKNHSGACAPPASNDQGDQLPAPRCSSPKPVPGRYYWYRNLSFGLDRVAEMQQSIMLNTLFCSCNMDFSKQEREDWYSCLGFAQGILDETNDLVDKVAKLRKRYLRSSDQESIEGVLNKGLELPHLDVRLMVRQLREAASINDDIFAGLLGLEGLTGSISDPEHECGNRNAVSTGMGDISQTTTEKDSLAPVAMEQSQRYDVMESKLKKPSITQKSLREELCSGKDMTNQQENKVLQVEQKNEVPQAQQENKFPQVQQNTEITQRPPVFSKQNNDTGQYILADVQPTVEVDKLVQSQLHDEQLKHQPHSNTPTRQQSVHCSVYNVKENQLKAQRQCFTDLSMLQNLMQTNVQVPNESEPEVSCQQSKDSIQSISQLPKLVHMHGNGQKLDHNQPDGLQSAARIKHRLKLQEALQVEAKSQKPLQSELQNSQEHAHQLKNQSLEAKLASTQQTKPQNQGGVPPDKTARPPAQQPKQELSLSKEKYVPAQPVQEIKERLQQPTQQSTYHEQELHLTQAKDMKQDSSNRSLFQAPLHLTVHASQSVTQEFPKPFHQPQQQPMTVQREDETAQESVGLRSRESTPHTRSSKNMLRVLNSTSPKQQPKFQKLVATSSLSTLHEKEAHSQKQQSLQLDKSKCVSKTSEVSLVAFSTLSVTSITPEPKSSVTSAIKEPNPQPNSIQSTSIAQVSSRSTDAKEHEISVVKSSSFTQMIPPVDEPPSGLPDKDICERYMVLPKIG